MHETYLPVVGAVEYDSCVSTQRCAALSYCTIGSPSSVLPQGRSKPQSVFPSAGSYSTVPSALLKTANAVFTHCTYCVSPAAPLGSGGAELTVNQPAGPLKARPTPRNF